MHVNPDSVYEATSPIISIGKLSVCFLSSASKTDDSYNNCCYFVFAQRKQLRCLFVKKKKITRSRNPLLFRRWYSKVSDVFTVKNILFIFKYEKEDGRKILKIPYLDNRKKIL